jgi:tetratricopeptide (TPR) repeat protein
MKLRTAFVIAILFGVGTGVALYASRAPERDPLAAALAPVSGGDDNAREIARLQQRIASGGAPVYLERLGWAFIARARREDDPGFYKLAERAAQAMLERAAEDDGALLLLGHALASQHRFAEAEAIARPLAARRGLPADHGLLGDALLSQGRLAEALPAYQAMMDLRPDSQAYARAAEVRWLTGDLEGAVEAMSVAARAVSRRGPAEFAWTWATLGLYQLRAGQYAEATRSCDIALGADPDSSPAWVVRGRLLLALDRPGDAADALARAAERSPLPETLWAYAEALRAAGRDEEAERVEERLVATGERSDPRGFALYLAARRTDLPRALRLLARELEARQDATTLAAVALAQSQSGDAAGAWPIMQRALAAGTPDPRLQLQAGLVAAAAGRRADAAAWFRAAAERRWLLLPSERRELDLALAS